MVIVLAGFLGAVVCTVIGVVVALRAALGVKRHVDATKLNSMSFLADVQRAEPVFARLQRAAERATYLLERAKVAIERINTGIRDLKLPQAMFALRTAGLAIRLLFNGR